MEQTVCLSLQVVPYPLLFMVMMLPTREATTRFLIFLLSRILLTFDLSIPLIMVSIMTTPMDSFRILLRKEAVLFIPRMAMSILMYPERISIHPFLSVPVKRSIQNDLILPIFLPLVRLLIRVCPLLLRLNSCLYLFLLLFSIP